MPAAIQAMPVAKLQAALVKSIANLKTRDRTIDTLRAQLKSLQATQSNSANAALSPTLPTSSPAVADSGAEKSILTAQLAAAQQRAAAADSRAAAADAECAKLVAASKGAAEAHAAQLADMAAELQSLRRAASEHEDAKV